jgi:hypothetical protein
LHRIRVSPALFARLRPSFRRNTATHSAPRRPGSQRARTQGRAKGRGLCIKQSFHARAFWKDGHNFVCRMLRRKLRVGADRMPEPAGRGNYQTKPPAPEIGSCVDHADALCFRSRCVASNPRRARLGSGKGGRLEGWQQKRSPLVRTEPPRKGGFPALIATRPIGTDASLVPP